MYSVQEIKELIAWVASNRIRGIEIERSGFRLKIDGFVPQEAVPHSVAVLHAPGSTSAALPSSPSASTSNAPTGSASAPGGSSGVEAEEEGLHYIPSPIVGTFYRSPGPDHDPFVKLGDRVTKGQTLCIVEAMKLMNEIDADVSGEVVRIFAQNVQPVEYGEKLFAIRPD